MAHSDKKIKDVDPAKLDNTADEKYPAAFQGKTDLLNDQTGALSSDEKTDFRSGDDGASSLDEEQALNENSDNVSAEEAADLEQAASRMPEEDDMLDQDFLDGTDSEGSALNESDEPLGGDLDISPDEADANIYDDNE